MMAADFVNNKGVFGVQQRRQRQRRRRKQQQRTTTPWLFLLLAVSFFLLSGSLSSATILSSSFLPELGLLPRLTFPGGIFSLFWNGCWKAYPRFVRFGFSGFDYSVIAKDDSIMQLAQAGTYIGPDDIQEYGSFLTENSPFIGQGRKINFGRLDFRYAGYDEDEGSCIFNLNFFFQHEHEEETNMYPAKYSYPIMFKAFYEPKEAYASRINVYFGPGFFQFVFFQLFDSNNTRQYICSVYNTECAGLIDEQQSNLSPSSSCESLLSELPMADGDQLWIDGNSQGCRALHAAFAANNPEQHCAHISFQEQLDTKGNIKCQKTEGVLPEDLFNSDDFAFWNEFCVRNGVDPIIGHNEPECEYNGGTC